MLDFVSLATMFVTKLSPLVAEGVGKLAQTVLNDAYTAIKERLRSEPSGKAAIERFEQNVNEGAPALQAELAKRLASDSALVRLLAESLEKFGAAPRGSLVGKIDAEKVVVAEKIDTVNM
jgi:hypothetical protein